MMTLPFRRGHDRDPFAHRRFLGRLGRWRTPLVVAAGGMLVAFAAWVVLVSSWLGVGHVDVTGAGHAKAALIARVAAIGPGTPLARLDLGAVAARVERLPGIASASVSREWPTGIRITVTQREPVAVVAINGSYKAMDATGHLFRSFASPPHRLPLVSANRLAIRDRAQALVGAAHAVGALTAPIVRQVSYVQVGSLDSIVLVFKNGERVRWGSADQSARKAEVLTALLKIKAHLYDVSVPEQPTTSAGP